MISLEKRIHAFSLLGKLLKERRNSNDASTRALQDAMVKSNSHNAWFSMDSINYALDTWADVLTLENLNKWLKPYNLSSHVSKTVGIVTAGNIPLVGMHDFVSVLLAGHKILVKQSSNDKFLLPIFSQFLIDNDPYFQTKIEFTEGKLSNFDAVIATGSNNTARYFEAYFNKYPHIIRKNRNAVAVLSGDETEQELDGLATDIFAYYGLGCRNVSKIFIPKGYELDAIFRTLYKYQEIGNHHKYKNNYDYNRAVYLMGGVPLLENGFVLFKEDTTYASPISVIYYEYYDDINVLKNQLVLDSLKIQCVVAQDGMVKNSVPFGKSQEPELWDYADGVDTIDFLRNL